MSPRERERKAYTYLFDRQSNAATVLYINDKTVQVWLPFGDSQKDYILPIDHRDRRALLVFDGHIPWQGLPRTTDVIAQEELGPSFCSSHQIRKDRDCEEPLPPGLERDQDGDMVAHMRRYFLLARSGALCVRRYMPENFCAQYVLVQIQETKHGHDVKWLTSSRD